MNIVNEETLLNTVRYLWNCALSYPISTLIFLLVTYYAYKIFNYGNIVVDYPNEVPPEVRQVSGQTAFPPHYPNGWIPVLESRAIGPSQVKSVLVFDMELAVIRVSSGQVYVIDAFCPHLGANLAVGGTVVRDPNCKEDCIRCPFHGWSFRMSDGQCANIPYDEATTSAKVTHWPVKEVNNVIFVWYHADRQEPSWELVPIPEIASGKRVYFGRTQHNVNCRIQEIPENGADLAHLSEIHVDNLFFGANLSLLNKLKMFRFFKHEWEAVWNPGTKENGDSHTSLMNVVNRTTLFGVTLFTVKFRVHYIGPAYVELTLKTNFLGGVEGNLLQLIKPIGPMRNSIIHQVYTEPTISGFIFAKFLLYAEVQMLERDIMVWNRKAFLTKPYFAKTEKSLVKYRRWFSQFYSQNSIDW